MSTLRLSHSMLCFQGPYSRTPWRGADALMLHGTRLKEYLPHAANSLM